MSERRELHREGITELHRGFLLSLLDCSLPGSMVHGNFPARVLEWVAISFSRGSSQPRDWIRVSRIAGRCFTIWATREALSTRYLKVIIETEERTTWKDWYRQSLRFIGPEVVTVPTTVRCFVIQSFALIVKQNGP